MNSEQYPLSASTAKFEYAFVSSGATGIFPELIQYSLYPEWYRFQTWTGLTSQQPIFNLAFGPLGENGEIDDLKVTNNGDMPKVISTVACSIIDFTNQYPNCLVTFVGSTSGRTYLYGRVLSENYFRFSEIFSIYGKSAETNIWVPFSADVRFAGFFLKRKSDE